MSSPSALRHIKPYYHAYEANCKGRWFGRTPLDVYTSEFRGLPYEHHYNTIVSGNMKLVKNPNAKNPTVISGPELLKTTIGPGDKIFHDEHVHEPPVLDIAPEIIYESDLQDGYVVVNKPPGIPVHPAATYYKNTITERLYEDRPDLAPLYPLHRIDKLVSGTLIFGKTHEAVSRLKALLRARDCDKTYLARVPGRFPDSATCKDPVIYVFGARRQVNQYNGAQTNFTRLFYDSESDQSVIQCDPVSGFPHQIRIHLRNLGFPILHDKLYTEKYTEVFRSKNEVTEKYMQEIYERSMVTRAKQEVGRCEECQMTLYKDPDPADLYITLHALRYRLGGNSWKTPPPDWAIY